jgi:DNA-binding MarR family transcriptional regulator
MTRKPATVLRDTGKTLPELDPMIHEPARLMMLAVLSECEQADFNFLLGITRLTRGNLSTHMARLVTAGYVMERKSFVDKVPHTSYQLSAIGRAAYKKYIADWTTLTQSKLKHIL